MLAISTATRSAATLASTERNVEADDIQVISYASTILLVVALSLSKLSVILWLERLQLSKTYKLCSMTAGALILIYMLSTAAGIIFQCQLPRPWDLRTGHCTSSQRFWTTTIAIDIALDLSLIMLPVVALMTLDLQQRKKDYASYILSLRTFLIIPSLIRLVYVQQPTPDHYIIMLENLPYSIATQCQVTIAAMLSCTMALPCIANLAEHTPTATAITLNKHWSGSSFGSNIADEYFASAQAPTMEPLQTIQASMKAPESSHLGSMLPPPSPAVGTNAKGAPLRPPPPSEHQRLDMSMFIHKPTRIRPPPVTLLGDRLYDRASEDRQCVENVRRSKHVTFDV
ncbi:hypothetical protein OPT61_g8141 [Boeremia exigua]|uniref:Uncharacterized protein n=1 Tax=Boeremia exigua TaxID=749465 RepID=A0ACC2HZF2_9PLEO|nr:hypothetical protein OPT61_g8141 [Boeremia exigua]